MITTNVNGVMYCLDVDDLRGLCSGTVLCKPGLWDVDLDFDAQYDEHVMSTYFSDTTVKKVFERWFEELEEMASDGLNFFVMSDALDPDSWDSAGGRSVYIPNYNIKAFAEYLGADLVTTYTSAATENEIGVWHYVIEE